VPGGERGQAFPGFGPGEKHDAGGDLQFQRGGEVRLDPIVQQALGRRHRVQGTGGDLVRPPQRLREEIGCLRETMMLGMFRAARRGEFSAASPALGNLLGRPATPLSSFLEGVAAAH